MLGRQPGPGGLRPTSSRLGVAGCRNESGERHRHCRADLRRLPRREDRHPDQLRRRRLATGGARSGRLRLRPEGKSVRGAAAAASHPGVNRHSVAIIAGQPGAGDGKGEGKMNRYKRMQNRQGVIAVAVAMVLAVGMWGGLPIPPQRVAAAGMSPAAGGGCSTASFMEVAGSPFGAGTHPFSVAVGDFNGDGKLDLAVANSGDNNVTIRLGDGTGAFPDAKSSTVGAGSNPQSVAVGDFNGDGKPDLGVANFNSNDVTIRLGDGTGGFP